MNHHDQRRGLVRAWLHRKSGAISYGDAANWARPEDWFEVTITPVGAPRPDADLVDGVVGPRSVKALQTYLEHAAGDVADRIAQAAFKVDSIHHLYQPEGDERPRCTCGFVGNARKRTQTEHITAAVVAEFAATAPSVAAADPVWFGADHPSSNVRPVRRWLCKGIRGVVTDASVAANSARELDPDYTEILATPICQSLADLDAMVVGSVVQTADGSIWKRVPAGWDDLTGSGSKGVEPSSIVWWQTPDGADLRVLFNAGTNA